MLVIHIIFWSFQYITSIPSDQVFSECRVPATFWGPATLAATLETRFWKDIISSDELSDDPFHQLYKLNNQPTMCFQGPHNFLRLFILFCNHRKFLIKF